MRSSFFKKFIFILATGLMLLIWVGCGTQPEGKIPITTSSKEALSDFMKGRDLFERLRAQESLQHFENAISKDPSFAMAYMFSAFGQPIAQGFFERVNKAVALKDKVSEGERLWIEAVKAGSDGFPVKQQELFQKLVTAFPNDERAHTNLGNSYFGTQKYEKAIEEYQKATTINPDFSQPYNQMGYAYRFLEKFDEAEQAFQKYIQLIPDDPNPYDSYAELLMKIGKCDESIEQYRKALEVNKNFVASHIGIATNYNFKGEYDKAREQLKELFYIARDDGEKRAARFAMTVSFVDEGNMEKAIEELKWQYSLGKNNNDAPNMAGNVITMGNIYFEMSDYDNALKKYDKALNIMEESNLQEEVKENARRINLYNTARVMIMKGKVKEAKIKADELMKEAMAANNTFQIWLAHELAGMINMKEKNYEVAISEFEQANLQNPYNLYRIAQVYDAQGNKEMAKEYYTKAANHNTLNSMNYAFIRHKAKEMLSSV